MEKGKENTLQQPKRRSARLIAISKPAEDSKYKEVDEESEEEEKDQFGSLENLDDSDWEAKVSLEDGEKKAKKRGKMTKKSSDQKKKPPEKKPKISLKKPEEIVQNADASTSTAINGSLLCTLPSTSSNSNAVNRKDLAFSSILSETKQTPKAHHQQSQSASSDDGEEDEWEALEPVHAKPTERSMVEVHLEGEAAEKFKSELNPLKARNAKEEEERAKWEHCMRLEIERRKKELQEDFHRIHFLAHIGHLRFLVSTLCRNRELLTAKMQGLLGNVVAPTNPAQMGKLLREHFRPAFRNQCDIFPSKPPMVWGKEEEGVVGHLVALMEHKQFMTDREIALLFFIFCAFLLDLPTRLCLAFTPMSRLLKLPKYLTEKKTKVDKNSKKKKKLDQSNEEDEEDSEEESSENEEEEEKMPRRKSAVRKRGKPTKVDEIIEEVMTKMNEDGKQVDNGGVNRTYWNEYWDEAEQRWICVDSYFCTIDQPGEIERKMTDKFLYVLAVDNEIGVRELAAKYKSNFLALETRRLRTDQEWIRQTMEFEFLHANQARARLEDVAILEHLKSKPLPLKLGEFKNHPLYALKRDLLKFEAIYPADTAPVGRVGKHEIFPRSSVHKLEGSLNWIKESRSIKEGEKPYKIVKARPKTNIPKEKRQPLTLDLFGHWQTEPYKPPVVQDGRIPRNEFGNIYMYKEEMLPLGCVHLRLNGIFNVARRLDLEAVPAVVGWEFSGGLNHPILDGCVVLEKDEEMLRSAWQEMARNKAENEAKKSHERVWKNWRKLVRGKLLLEQMRERFK